jgi:hypothetical protein
VEPTKCSLLNVYLFLLVLQCGMTRRVLVETMRVCLESPRVRALSSTSDHKEFVIMLIKPIGVIKRLWDSWKRPWVLSENVYRKQSIHLLIFNFLCT